MIDFYKCHFHVLKSRNIYSKFASININNSNTGIYQDVDRSMEGELVAKYHNCTIFNHGELVGRSNFFEKKHSRNHENSGSVSKIL